MDEIYACGNISLDNLDESITLNCSHSSSDFSHDDYTSTWYENDLQLAAELGKTLLERNKELENSLRHFQQVVDDQVQEIEYLSKQTTALKEVNESRLRVTEQLEVSTQDLELANMRLQAEANADKKKIATLHEMIEQLERRCDELQGSIDEWSAKKEVELKMEDEFDSEHHLSAAEVRRRSTGDQGPVSCQICSNNELRLTEVCELRERMKEAQRQKLRERGLREEIEMEAEVYAEENGALRRQLVELKQRLSLTPTKKKLTDEFGEADSGFCSRCCQSADKDVSGHTEIEEDSCYILTPSPQPDCDLSATNEDAADVGTAVQPPSILSEVDAQYRQLIDKYEAILAARNSPQPREKAVKCDTDSRSETEDSSLSSGFCEEVRVAKSSQTELSLAPGYRKLSRKEFNSRIKRLANKSGEGHFNGDPEYKKLFDDIFAVLKTSVDKNVEIKIEGRKNKFSIVGERVSTPSPQGRGLQGQGKGETAESQRPLKSYAQVLASGNNNMFKATNQKAEFQDVGLKSPPRNRPYARKLS